MMTNGQTMRRKTVAALSGLALISMLAGCSGVVGASSSSGDRRPDGTFDVSATDTEILLTETPKIDGKPHIIMGTEPKEWKFGTLPEPEKGQEKEYEESISLNPPTLDHEEGSCRASFSSGTTDIKGSSDLYLSRADMAIQTGNRGEDEQVIEIATKTGGKLSFIASRYYQEGMGNGLVASRVIEYPVETYQAVDFDGNKYESVLYPALRFSIWCSTELPDEKTVEKVLSAFTVDMTGK